MLCGMQLTRGEQEDEDAPRTAYCDVRFDVRPDPKNEVKAIYCAYTGKVSVCLEANLTGLTRITAAMARRRQTQAFTHTHINTKVNDG
jgi:hypothetical protein